MLKSMHCSSKTFNIRLLFSCKNGAKIMDFQS